MRRRTARFAAWLLLALPGGWWLARLASGAALPMDLLAPTGELAVQLTVLAMLAGPLAEAFPGNRVLRLWLGARRWLGLAAFAYALLHLAIYAADMGSVAAMVDEIALPAIWTGWLALALMLPPAAISFDAAMRALGRRWKQVQRLVYAAVLLALVHWLLLDWHWLPAILHSAPLIGAWTLRGWRRQRRRAVFRSDPERSLA